MLGVCTIWDEDFTAGISVKRWYNLYKQAAKALGATHLIWVEQGPYSVPGVADQEITTEKYEHLSDVRDAYPNATLVFLDAAGSEDLAAFIHPEGDTIYVVGTDSDGLGEHLVPGEEDDVVRVSASIELWSHMALAIALYDRQSKAV